MQAERRPRQRPPPPNLMVMVSPGWALMFQLQFNCAGYWKGHPGLVMTPLGECRSSAPSPQAGREEEVDVRLLSSGKITPVLNSPFEIPDTKTLSFL